MSRSSALVIVAMVAALVVAPSHGEEIQVAADRAGGPVVVELFTSQGCSSCPPADRLLSKMASDPEYRGRVYPLAFHVDYWNYLGWRDPFSSARWSARQSDYARALGAGNYTPQLVVDGTSECVGSREDEVRRAVERALATPAPGRVELALAAGSDPQTVRATVHARFDGAAEGRRIDALVALVEDGLVTPVGRGENGGRTLANDRVVRRLERAFTLGGDAGTEESGGLQFSRQDYFQFPRNRMRIGIVKVNFQRVSIHYRIYIHTVTVILFQILPVKGQHIECIAEQSSSIILPSPNTATSLRLVWFAFPYLDNASISNSQVEIR